MIASESIPHDATYTGEPTAHVLVVDDDPGDIELMRIAFEMCQIPVHIDAAADGTQAVQLLREAIASHEAPELILLDLNMPRMDGCEVMAAMRESGLTERIPVIVLSTSHYNQDKERCLKAGASAYFPKPDNLEQLLTLARRLYSYFSNP